MPIFVFHTDPTRQPPEIPHRSPEHPDIAPHHRPEPEIEPYHRPEPEIPGPPADPVVPSPGHAPEITPDQTPTEIPQPGAAHIAAPLALIWD